MSRSLRALAPSLRVPGPCPFSTRLFPGAAARKRTYFAMRTRAEDSTQRLPRSPSPSRIRAENPQSVLAEASSSTSHVARESESTSAVAEETEEESWNGPKSSWKETDERYAEHLNGLFPTLSFPPELARRILTHGSHPASAYGHNAAFSFIGRRVLESYLLLMLSSSKAVKPTHDLDAVVQRTLNSYVVGQHVGSKWGLGRKLRWTPTVPKAMLKPGQDTSGLLRSVGLYKIQGDAVSAVVGGIFHQFGGSVAHRVFHTRVLPNLIHLQKDGLPSEFAKDAMNICALMGGCEGPLLSPTLTSAQPSSPSSVGPLP